MGRERDERLEFYLMVGLGLGLGLGPGPGPGPRFFW